VTGTIPEPERIKDAHRGKDGKHRSRLRYATTR
jgi:hypothetical protein